jgi:hypothetical protein
MRALLTIVAILAGVAVGVWSAGDADPFVVAFCAVFWGGVGGLAVRFLLALKRSQDGETQGVVAPASPARFQMEPGAAIEVDASDEGLSQEAKRFLRREGW